jgi:hypothetical protein
MRTLAREGAESAKRLQSLVPAIGVVAPPIAELQEPGANRLGPLDRLQQGRSVKLRKGKPNVNRNSIRYVKKFIEGLSPAL